MHVLSLLQYCLSVLVQLHHIPTLCYHYTGLPLILPPLLSFVGLFFFFFFVFILIKLLSVMWLQMGSRFKKTVMSENVRRSLHGWHRRVRARNSGTPLGLLTATSTSSSLDLSAYEMERINSVASTSREGSASKLEDTLTPCQLESLLQSPRFEASTSNRLQVPQHCDQIHDSHDSDEKEDKKMIMATIQKMLPLFFHFLGHLQYSVWRSTVCFFFFLFSFLAFVESGEEVFQLSVFVRASFELLKQNQ